MGNILLMLFTWWSLHDGNVSLELVNEGYIGQNVFYVYGQWVEIDSNTGEIIL